MHPLKKMILSKTHQSTMPPAYIEESITDNGPCEGYYSFKVITEIDVTITISTDLHSVATLIPVVGLPLPVGYIGIDSSSVVTTNVDKGYMLGVNATLYPGGGAPSFISRIIINITNTATGEPITGIEFSRNHTNAVC